MITFIAGFLKFFVTTAFLIGALSAACAPVSKKQFLKHLSWSAFIGIAAGLAFYGIVFSKGIMVETKIIFFSLMIFTGLLTLISSLMTNFDRNLLLPYICGPLGFILFLSTLGVFAFIPFAQDQALSLTSVINTELILNLAAICIGVGIIVTVVPLTIHMLDFIGRKPSVFLLIVLIFFPILNGSAEVLLGMMQIQFIEITKFALSFVAKVIGFQYMVLYFEIGLFCLATFVFYLKRPRIDVDTLKAMGNAERRKETGYILREYRWVKSLVVVIVLILSPLLYYDLYASKPPKITKPTPITPEKDGAVHIKIEDVKDGNLHRYSYVTGDGTKVRFFLINRYPDRIKIGVVFDSCLICGDMGYNQEGNDVVCLACNVRMFIPSIGKPGGCNPIPLKSKVVGDEILILAEDLDNGSEYFSEVVEIEVKDPVSKATMINLKAPFRYDYKGRTFFFESRDNYDAFVAQPEQYAPNLKRKPTRADGYPSEEGS